MLVNGHQMLYVTVFQNGVENSVVYLQRKFQCTISLQTEPMALSAISQMLSQSLASKSEGLSLLKSGYATFTP